MLSKCALWSGVFGQWSQFTLQNAHTHNAVAYSKVDLSQHGDFSGWKAQLGIGSFHLIQNPQDYLEAEPTFKRSYAPQSGGIFCILNQVQESFGTNLSDSQKELVANQKAYEDLKAATTDEIKVDLFQHVDFSGW